jgi:hypothetical protein
MQVNTYIPWLSGLRHSGIGDAQLMQQLLLLLLLLPAGTR